MGLTEKQRKQIISLVGEKGLKRILERNKQAESDNELIKAIGVRSKAFEGSGFTQQQLKWIQETLGAEGVKIATSAGSREKALTEINLLAKAQNRSKNKSAGHTNTVKITASDSDQITAYKGMRGQVADDAATNGSRLPTLERATPIIENDDDRLLDYAKRLKVPPKLHTAFLRILGKDKLESVYYRSDTTQKALSGGQQVELVSQQARALGIPEALDTGFDRVLGTQGYARFIEQLANSFFWGQPVKPADAIKSVKNPTITRQSLFNKRSN